MMEQAFEFDEVSSEKTWAQRLGLGEGFDDYCMRYWLTPPSFSIFSPSKMGGNVRYA
jgi:hypothetical protein